MATGKEFKTGGFIYTIEKQGVEKVCSKCSGTCMLPYPNVKGIWRCDCYQGRVISERHTLREWLITGKNVNIEQRIENNIVHTTVTCIYINIQNGTRKEHTTYPGLSLGTGCFINKEQAQAEADKRDGEK